jgi:hypothetical protein
MHLFRSHKETSGMFRGHARFTLPDNPVCWLTGHHPKLQVVEPTYSAGEAWVKVTCAWCGRRYRENPDLAGGIARDYDTPAKRRELAARRAENARRDPANYLRGVERRQGWNTNDAGVNVEAHWWGFKPAKMADNLGFRIHFGDTYSETPYDFWAGAGVASVYLTIEANGRFAEWIGRGHKRDLSLKIHDRSLWWKLWYDGEQGNAEHHRCDSWRQPKLWPWSAGRRKHRGWMCLRDGNIDLNPVDAFYGSRLWLRDESFGEEKATTLVHVGDFPRDEYLVDFTLERRQVRRKAGPAWARRVKRVDYSADAKCDPGIPIRNHDWKGDNMLGWSVRIPASAVEDGTWPKEAVAGTIEHVRRDRKHYGYVPRKAEAL